MKQREGGGKESEKNAELPYPVGKSSFCICQNKVLEKDFPF
jgi:hypothetical protein